jgi:hypothetical protein
LKGGLPPFFLFETLNIRVKKHIEKLC